MKENKNAIIIDNDGYMVDLVLVEFKEKEERINSEKSLEVPMFYEIQEGESLIYEDISTAISMVKPRWINSSWQETATEEEIKESILIEEPQPPTELELAIKELTLMIEQLNNSSYTSNKNIQSNNEMEILNNESVVVKSWVNLVKNKNIELEHVPNLFNLKNIVKVEVNNH